METRHIPSLAHPLWSQTCTLSDYVIPLHKPCKLPLRQRLSDRYNEVHSEKNINIYFSVSHFSVGDFNNEPEATMDGGGGDSKESLRRIEYV